MKLSRIRLEAFRQFRDAIEIDALTPGINLLTGPNEAGKSTLVAAIRAAFFERHRSGSVEDFRPWGDSSAAPTVELDFVIGDTEYRLSKRFLTRKRCELRVGTQGLDGDEAEEQLAQLLGFQHATRGLSKSDHWGIPGLLWIQQGAAQEVHDAVGHATDHLRSALDESLGEVTSSSGDEVLARIEARRNELLTPAGSKPKGRFAEALRQQTLLGDALAELDSRIAAYRDKVDQLAALRSEHVAAEQDLPWLSYREQQRQASEKLAELKRVEDELASERQREAQADTRIRLLREQLEGFASQARAVAERRAALEAAKQAQSLAAERLTQAAAARASALAKHEAAREALRVARQHDLRQQREREHEALETRLAACGETLAQAEELHRGLLELRRKAAASEIGTEDLETLRQQRDALRELEIRRQGAATGLRYQLADGHHIQLDDEALSGAGERRLLEVSTITLPGVGELEISPGGADLPQLQRERLAIADRHEALLRQLGLPSLAAAQTRHGRHAELLGDIRTAEATLSALAPTGMETLRGEIASLKARAEEVRRILDEFPAETAGGQPIPVSVAEADEAAASARLTTTSESHQGVQLEAGSAQASCEAAKRELDDAQHILDVPDRARRLADAERELTDAIADRSALAQRIEELNKRLSDSRPELLEQDVERFRMSAEQHERGHAERGVALARLDAELQAAGAQGLDEQRAEMARDLAAASRHATELDRLARALDYLVTLMREKRNALTRKLQAPLQKYLDHYLRILLPDARLEIDEDLRPGALTRAGAHGAERGGFESLSFGAREQMGVISRLAYADLLREAGRPTLIILDDALVHSDAQRLAQMKRVLFDAASRHQILLFSCHPEKWADLGVAARPLSSLPTVPRE